MAGKPSGESQESFKRCLHINLAEHNSNFDDIKDKRWIIIEGSKLENEQFDITSEGIITSFTGE